MIDSFKRLHKQGDPLVLFNVWDTGSAAAVCKAGSKAIATGSAPVAMSQGFSDGEQIPFEIALANVERIISAVDVPVTMDLEGGYGEQTEVIEKTVSAAVATGIVGFNFEDQIVGTSNLYDTQTQVKRVSAARKAADSVSGSFLNGLADEKLIERLCNEVKLPVNIIALPNVPPKAVLVKLGVARISYGPVPYLKMMKSLTEAASEAFS